MPLEFDHLRKSYQSLAELLEVSENTECIEQLDAVAQDAIWSAVIKKFEITYTLAVKAIRRQLSEIVAYPRELEEMSFANLMRDAARAGLIHDPVAYMGYKNLINKTPYIYDPELVKTIIAAMPDFLDSMRFLIKETTRRNS